MKITWKHGDRLIEFEPTPTPPERFSALCKLAGAAICGAVLLGAIALVGFWAIPWAVGMLALYGIYLIFRNA